MQLSLEFNRVDVGLESVRKSELLLVKLRKQLILLTPKLVRGSLKSLLFILSRVYVVFIGFARNLVLFHLLK